MKCAVGLDLGGTSLKYGLVSATGAVLRKGERAVPVDAGRSGVFDCMRGAMEDAFGWARDESVQIVGIGAGCPGTIDVQQGISLGPTPHLPDWEDAPIRSMLQSASGLPAWIDNDANMAAYAEAMIGAGRGHHTVVMLTLGTGIGGGIVLDGQVYRGAMFNGAELGHIVIETNGRPCPCGNHGCLERYAGGKAMVDDAEQTILEGHPSLLVSGQITPLSIFQAAGLGDPVAKEIVKRATSSLAAGLSTIANILNPNILILGGGISNAGRDLLQPVCHELEGRLMKPMKNRMRLVLAQMGNDAGIVGSALMAFRELGISLEG